MEKVVLFDQNQIHFYHSVDFYATKTEENRTSSWLNGTVTGRWFFSLATRNTRQLCLSQRRWSITRDQTSSQPTLADLPGSLLLSRSNIESSVSRKSLLLGMVKVVGFVFVALLGITKYDLVLCGRGNKEARRRRDVVFTWLSLSLRCSGSIVVEWPKKTQVIVSFS